MRVLAAANVALTQKRAGRRGQPSLRLAAALPAWLRSRPGQHPSSCLGRRQRRALI